jgi:GT2 family glycosyltransferase
MSNFSFIILHYKALESTLRCVESVFSLDIQSDFLNIVVVENGSQDDIEGYLRENFNTAQMRRITVLISEANLGFAKGNNLGFKYARENFHPDFVVVANNDVVFGQTNMCTCIEASYKKRPFHILGPDVFNPLMKIHQSPGVAHMPVTKEYVENIRTSFEMRLRRSYSKEKFLSLKFRFANAFLGKCLKQGKLIIKGKLEQWNQPQENVELQGSCVIYSRLYMDVFDWAFYPGTFMYLEELISLYVSQKNNFIHVYDPSIQIQHMHGVSTAMDYPNMIERHRFFLKENIKSADILLRLMNVGIE